MDKAGGEQLCVPIYATATCFLLYFQKHKAAPRFAKFAKTAQDNYFTQRKSSQSEKFQTSHTLTCYQDDKPRFQRECTGTGETA